MRNTIDPSQLVVKVEMPKTIPQGLKPDIYFVHLRHG